MNKYGSSNHHLNFIKQIRIDGGNNSSESFSARSSAGYLGPE